MEGIGEPIGGCKKGKRRDSFQYPILEDEYREMRPNHGCPRGANSWVDHTLTERLRSEAVLFNKYDCLSSPPWQRGEGTAPLSTLARVASRSSLVDGRLELMPGANRLYSLRFFEKAENKGCQEAVDSLWTTKWKGKRLPSGEFCLESHTLQSLFNQGIPDNLSEQKKVTFHLERPF
jgi:hypothetical protein